MNRALLLAALLAPLAAHAAEDDPPAAAPALANPASAYCVSLGGTVEIRAEDKGEVGYCHLPDGKVVEEWELFRSQES